MSKDLSDKAKENLRRNEEFRNQQSKFINLQPGEKRVLHFDPEKMEPVEKDFNGDGKMTTRYQYTVTDPNDANQTERYITFSKRASAQVDACLIEGHSILKIQNRRRQRYPIYPYACMITYGHRGSPILPPNFFQG